MQNVLQKHAHKQHGSICHTIDNLGMACVHIFSSTSKVVEDKGETM